MPLEAKDIFTVLGLEEDPEKLEKPEEFKALFESKFTSKANPDKETKANLFGIEYGKFGDAMKKLLKKHGVENALSKEEFKEKNFVELLQITEEKLSEQYGNKIKELEGKSGQGSDEKIKEYESELNKYKIRLTEEAQQKDKVLQEYEGFKTKSANEFKNYKKQIQVGEYEKNFLKFGSGVKDLEKKGFVSEFYSKYDFDYNDAGELLPIDKTTNTFIPNPKITGKYLSPAELYEQETIKAGVAEKNQHQQQNNQQRIFNTQQNNNQQQVIPAGMPERKVAPRA